MVEIIVSNPGDCPECCEEECVPCDAFQEWLGFIAGVLSKDAEITIFGGVPEEEDCPDGCDPYHETYVLTGPFTIETADGNCYIAGELGIGAICDGFENPVGKVRFAIGYMPLTYAGSPGWYVFVGALANSGALGAYNEAKFYKTIDPCAPAAWGNIPYASGSIGGIPPYCDWDVGAGDYATLAFV